MTTHLLCNLFSSNLSKEYSTDPIYFQEATRRTLRLVALSNVYYSKPIHDRAVLYCIKYYAEYKTMHRCTDDPDFKEANLPYIGSPAMIYLISYHTALTHETDMFVSIKSFIADLFGAAPAESIWEAIYNLTLCQSFKHIFALQRRVLKCTNYGGVGLPTPSGTSIAARCDAMTYTVQVCEIEWSPMTAYRGDAIRA